MKNGSVLLLTIMIMAVLTTVTLGGVAVRFAQLSATDKLGNAQVAKQAADGALTQLRSQLGANTPPTAAHLLNLDQNSDTVLSGNDTAGFKPNPLQSVATYEPLKTSLPRCLAVGVLSPWVNDGHYLFDSQDQANAQSGNPALIFYYANIISDTALGTIANNQNDLASDQDKQKTIGELANIGHFYNPYSTNIQQSDPNYWLLRLAGPRDEFLTKKSIDNQTSYFKNLDFVYLPYLPRFVDSGLFDANSTSGQISRVSADDLRQRFESVIRNNNFKVWLDAAVTDDLLYQYGFGDLFVNDSQYRLNWLQPTLWNDTPENDLVAPYQASDADAAQLTWSKKNQPLYAASNGAGPWDISILKGAKSFSFIKLATGSNNTTFSPGATIDGLLYGSLEGLRLNQPITLLLYDKANHQPLDLDSEVRSFDQGKDYNVVISKLGPASTSNGLEAYPISFRLSSVATDTPKLKDTREHLYPEISDVDLVSVLAPPQFSTNRSITGTTLVDPGNDGKDVAITFSNQSCNPNILTACPAVGDLIGLTKAGTAPIWGRVTSIDLTSAGTSLTKLTVDKLHQSPKPLKEMASTVFTDPADSRTKIAFYGGAMTTNSYDGGLASENNELWIYDPEADSWQWPTVIGSPPNQRAGSSLVFDRSNGRLILSGGYYHELVGASCTEANQTGCLYANRAGLRLAKRVTNDVFAYTLTTASWEKISYSFADPQKIQDGATYQLKVASTLADRSGLDSWQWRLYTTADPTHQLSLRVDGAENVNLPMAVNSAGLAKGSEVFLSGVRNDNVHFTGWGKVTDTNFPAKTINLVVYGYKAGSGTSVTLKQLSVTTTNRQAVASSCTGQFDGTYYSCNLTNNDSSGYALGDQVVLEQYNTNPLTTKLSAVLTGYITGIENGKVYLVADERMAGVNDFADSAGGKLAGESAVAFPAARYGASWQVQPTDPTHTILFQGGATNIAERLRFSDIWQANFSAGGGSGSVAWSLKVGSSTIPSTASNSYNLQVVSTPANQIVSTADTNSPPIITTKCPDNQPLCTNGNKVWDNTAKWTLPLKTTGIESSAFGKVVAGASVLIERQDGSSGDRRGFHGVVAAESFSNANNDTNLVVQHDTNYPGDLGLSGDSNLAKVTLFYSLRNDVVVGAGSWSVVANAFDLSPTSSKSAIPVVGSTISFWQTNVSGGSYDVYTATVRERSYNTGTGKFRFTLTDKPLNTPPSAAHSSSALVADGATIQALTISAYGLPVEQGGVEWFAPVSDAEPRWQARFAAADSAVSDRPSPRLGAGLATLYGSAADKLYLAGGSVVGRYATVWRETQAGKADATNRATWQLAKSPPTAGADLPALAGGGLFVYQSGSVNKAIFFGGKLKLDASTTDYGKSLGAKVLGRPDLDRFSLSDDSFSLAGKNAVTSGGSFVDTLDKNFSGPAAVKQSFQFTSNGLQPQAPGSWNYAQTACAYLGQAQTAACASPMLIRQLGSLGRISGDPSSQGTYGGYSWGSSAAVLNPGTAFLQENSNSQLILSGPGMSLFSTNGRAAQSGYYPYQADTNLPYGTNSTNFSSDKTLLLAGFARISGGGSFLVTPVGVGSGLSTGRNDRWYSYCPKSETTNISGGDYSCALTAQRYLPFLPDPEDQLFFYDSALALSTTDSYKVVGYYGGVRRGYLVVSRTGKDLSIQEIVP